MSELRIYESDNAPVSVRLEGQTARLTQQQMAALFDTTPENIPMHLKKIFHEGELAEPATTTDFLAAQTEGRHKKPDANTLNAPAPLAAASPADHNNLTTQPIPSLLTSSETNNSILKGENRHV